MDGSGPPAPAAPVRRARGCGRDRVAAFMARLLGRPARCAARVRCRGRPGVVRGGDLGAALAGPAPGRLERSGRKRRRGVSGRLLRSQRPDRRGLLPRVGPGRARHHAGGAGGFCRRHRLVRPLSPARLALGRDAGDSARGRPSRPGLLATPGPTFAVGGLDRAHRGHLRLPWPGPIPSEEARFRVVELDSQQRRTLVWAGLGVVLTAFDGSVLVLALPAIASEFHARVPALSNLGSVLALGGLGALPLATLADRFGRRRLIALGVGGFSIANFASAFAPSLEALAVLRLVAVCFEVLVGGVATALIVEEAPRGRRGQAVSVLAVLSGGGTGLTVLAYPVVAPHWRWLFLAGGIGLVAAPLIWRRLPEGRAWQRVRLSGSALRLLLEPAWRRRLFVIAGTTALLAVLLEPAGLLFTLFASQALHMSPVGISELIAVSGIAGGASYVAGGFLTDRFGRRIPGTALTAATA